MHPSEFAIRRIVTVPDSESITEAAARMRYDDVGSAAVVDCHNVLVGIITERDVVRAVADGADTAETKVFEYMTADPTTIGPQTAVHEAARIMIEAGIRHLPVVAPDRSVIGLASIRDVLSSLLSPPRCFETRCF